MTPRCWNPLVFAFCLSWGALSAVGCGGAPPPKSGADAETAGDGANQPESDVAPSDDDSGSAQEPAAAQGDATSASKEDVQAVLQLVIDDEELTPYLHLERSDRFPIRIAGDLPQGLELTKATQPVQVVDVAAAKEKPTIVFTEVTVRGDKASVRYRYDVEGVRGSCTLSKRDGRWILAQSRVTAR